MQPPKSERHELNCIRNFLKKTGEDYKNHPDDEYKRGIGQGLLSALDLLNGKVIGHHPCIITKNVCICKKKRVLKYDHYEKEE